MTAILIGAMQVWLIVSIIFKYFCFIVSERNGAGQLVSSKLKDDYPVDCQAKCSE